MSSVVRRVARRRMAERDTAFGVNAALACAVPAGEIHNRGYRTFLDEYTSSAELVEY